MKLNKKGLAALLIFGVSSIAYSDVAEIFAKGFVRKTNHSRTSWTTTVSASAGLAFTLIPRIRLEGRYSKVRSVQNLLDGASSVDFVDIITNTDLYSLGIDVDILGPRSTFRPFIFLGAGYLSTSRSYGVVSGGTTTDVVEPRLEGFSANAALGFRVRVARSLALEAEVFGFSNTLDQDSPLIDWYANFGIRIYI